MLGLDPRETPDNDGADSRAGADGTEGEIRPAGSEDVRGGAPSSSLAASRLLLREDLTGGLLEGPASAFDWLAWLSRVEGRCLSFCCLRFNP